MNTPAKTWVLYSAIATRKARLVKPYIIIGIHGFIRLYIRNPRGRVYDEDGCGVWGNVLWNGVGCRSRGDADGDAGPTRHGR